MKFSKTILPNGLRVILVPMADNPSVTVLAMVEAGSKYEEKKTNGLSHFLEHMVFKGTEKRPNASDISRELDGMGANYNAFTSQEYTGYYAKAAANRFDEVLEIISDMYLNPVFDEKEIEKEKGVIIEEIRMYQDLPQRHVHDLLMQLLYGDQPVGWNIAGDEANVRSFKRDDFITYRKKHYTSKATVVIVAGSFDEGEAVAAIRERFGSVIDAASGSKLKVKESQSVPEIKTLFKETDQTHIAIGIRTFPVNDERAPVMQVLGSILGSGMSSRLFAKMRDELGICYYIRAENDPYTDHGVFTISAGLDNKRVEQGVRSILAECARLKDELVSAAELKKVKDSIAGGIMLALETSDARAEYCGFQEILKRKIESPSEMLQKVKKVTSKDVQDLAKEIFTDKALNMALIGRFKDGEIFKPYFSFKLDK